jgi:hypothetical protein
MTNDDYKLILAKAVESHVKLGMKRDEIDWEMSKLNQFIAATLNMLPDDDRRAYMEKLNELSESSAAKNEGLTDTIRRVLKAVGTWQTVARVRDRLVTSGFDFSAYMANPLASVSTTLRRMKDPELESTVLEGVTMYRWNEEKAEKSDSSSSPFKDRNASRRRAFLGMTPTPAAKPPGHKTIDTWMALQPPPDDNKGGKN